MLPISVYENSEGELTATNLEDEGIFININGILYDKDSVLHNVQVEISGGTDTNGAISTVITNSEGRFFISANVSSEKIAAMQNASIRIFKPGYHTVLLESQDLTVTSSIIGMNILLTKDNTNAPLVYHESFETLSEGAVCGSWAAMPFSPNDDWLGGYYPKETPETNTEETTKTKEPILLTNLWHQHTSSSVVQNQAYVNNAVLLAPDDTSEGYIPEPQSQAACWYGSAQPNSLSQGNFLGEAYTEQIDLNGGKSRIRNAGAIISETIDFTNETAPLSLSFKTWWEIESVNPNENGFDLMIIQYSTNNGQSWHSLARLNPLSDPAESSESIREPIPYSNLGYNKSPNWVWLEPISLDALAGYQAQLRFIFSTNDDLFNGFRGWLIDDIRIERKVGTFPLYVEPDFILLDAAISEPSEEDIINIWARIRVKPEYQETDAYALLIHIDEEGAMTVLDTQTFAETGELFRLNGSINASPDQADTFLIQLFDSEDNLIDTQDINSMIENPEPY